MKPRTGTMGGSQDCTANRRLVLASASPRRAELLRLAGIPFDVQPADVDESVLARETPRAHVRRLAEAKARAVFARDSTKLVLGADTIVVLDGEIMGKPLDDADATRMLRLLSGRWHEVITGVALIGFVDKPSASIEVETTRVEMATLSSETIAWYVGTGEPLDKAGSYAIQGIASRFIPRIEGSYSNVVGLPVALVATMLARVAGGRT